MLCALGKLSKLCAFLPHLQNEHDSLAALKGGDKSPLRTCLALLDQSDYWQITGHTEPEDIVQDVSGESKGGLYKGQATETQEDS